MRKGLRQMMSLGGCMFARLPVANGGVAAAHYCFVRLYFSAAGPGPWSLDPRREK